MDQTTSDFAQRLSVLLSEFDSPWHVEIVDCTGSTNADLVRRAHAGEDVRGHALVALNQTKGRGRLERNWVVPEGTSLAISIGVDAGADASTWWTVPLMAGLGVARSLDEVGAHPQLKWPNDVLIDGRKVCGILVEMVGTTAVVGMGVNVGQTADTIGFPQGISLAMAGVDASREEVCASVLRRVGQVMSHPDLVAYKQRCVTLGSDVRIWIDEEHQEEGRALDVADDGELLVDVGGEVRSFASGDVYHLRDAH